MTKVPIDLDNRVVRNADGVTFQEYTEQYGIADPHSIAFNYADAWRDGYRPKPAGDNWVWSQIYRRPVDNIPIVMD
jgi:hypothetical protein